MLVGRVVAGLRGAERRHLDHFAARVHVHEPEATADDERAPEQRLDLLRMRVGRDVEVLRLDAEHQVAHRAADDERLEPRFLQLARDRPRACAHLVRADRMLPPSVDAWLARPQPRAGSGRADGGSSKGGGRAERFADGRRGSEEHEAALRRRRMIARRHLRPGREIDDNRRIRARARGEHSRRRLDVQLSARHRSERRRQDHRQSGFHAQRSRPADHPLHRGRRHGRSTSPR